MPAALIYLSFVYNVLVKIKRILITSDDGFDSQGVRILAHHLKRNFELKIAGTQEQQSGVSGRLSLQTGGVWGAGEVSGVEALWVDGTPCDALECARAYFEKPFDLVISGINWGVNIGAALLTSGTFSSAFYSIGGMRLAPRALAMSWDLPRSMYFTRERVTDGEVPEEFLLYPGEVARKVFTLALDHDFWGATILNVNFPRTKSATVCFTKPLPFIDQFYPIPIPLDRKHNRYSYDSGKNKNVDELTEVDIGVVKRGVISITPCVGNYLDKAVFNRVKEITFTV